MKAIIDPLLGRLRTYDGEPPAPAKPKIKYFTSVFGETTATISAKVIPMGGGETTWKIFTGDTNNPTAEVAGGTLTKGTVVSSDMTGLTPNKMYYWKVTAVNSIGTETSEIQSFTTAIALPLIEDVEATEITDTTATLSAQITPYADATYVVEYRKVGDTVWIEAQADDLIQEAIVYAELTDLEFETAYEFRVRAENATGESVSDVEPFTTLEEITEPAILQTVVANFDFEDLANITKDENNSMTKWKSKNNPDIFLERGATSTNYAPIWTYDGFTFDGIRHYMKGTFTFDLPCFVYMLVKVEKWVSGTYIFAPNAVTSYGFQMGGTKPECWMRGTSSAKIVNATELTEGDWHIVRAFWKTGDSKLIIDGNTALTSTTVAVANFDGFVISSKFDGNFPSKIVVRNVILASSTEGEADIYAYLETKKPEAPE